MTCLSTRYVWRMAKNYRAGTTTRNEWRRVVPLIPEEPANFFASEKTPLIASVGDDCLQRGFSRNSAGRWQSKLPQRADRAGVDRHLSCCRSYCKDRLWQLRIPIRCCTHV